MAPLREAAFLEASHEPAPDRSADFSPQQRPDAPPLRAEARAPERHRAGTFDAPHRFMAPKQSLLAQATVHAPPSPTASDASSTSPTPYRREGHLLVFGKVRVDPRARSVTVPSQVNMTNGVVEYVLVADYGKTHESLLVTDARAQDLQAALLLLNAQPTGPQGLDPTATQHPPGSLVRLALAWQDQGRQITLPLDQAIGLTDGDTGEVNRPLPPGPWLFNGSRITAEGFAAYFEGSLISLIRDTVAILNNPRPDQDDDEIHAPFPGRLPAPRTAVDLIIEVPQPAAGQQSTNAPPAARQRP